jgi:hypothetical protein
MSKRKFVAMAVAMALASPALAQAATDAELAQIREQIRQLKESYEARVQTLEKRLQEMEAAGARADANANASASAARVEPPPQPSGRAASESAFNPAVSLVLAGAYGNLSQDPAHYAITGFVPANNGVSPGTRGTSLKESELSIAANVDPYFRGSMLLSVDESNAASVEEASFQTIGLGNGLTIKGGRFFSAIGYQNEIHSHAWDFVDEPLVYRAFLGGGNYADDGLQFKWLAPTDSLIELGGEIGRGKDTPGTNRGKNGIAAGTLFAHYGGDFGESHSYRLGVSALRTSPQDAQTNDVDGAGNSVTNTFTGKTGITGVDFIYKYAPNGNTTDTNFKLQGEYFRRHEDGTLTFDTTGIDGLPPRNIADGYSSLQSGWYLQGVYQFMPQWRLGLRFDRLDGGTVNVGAANFGNVPTFDYNPTRTSLMLDYNPSEFSRIRLQFAQDKSRQDVTDNQFFIQYIYSLGAHGAHKF